jgi:subtilisin-like proprotein convertase family protein
LALKSDSTVVAWGISPDSGQTAVPAGLSNVVAIAAGARHSLALVNRPLTGTNQPVTFSNGGRITINDYAPASPYPSGISVSGLAGRIAKITATIHRLSHTSVADVNILLCSPGGQNVLLLSHAGSGVAQNVELTFDDSAATAISGAPLSGTYRPTQVIPIPSFPATAPARPYGTNLAVFNNSDPNGVWNLFVLDDVFLDSGVISNGWSLAITTWGNVPTVAPPVSTTVEIGSAVRFKARAVGDPPLHFQWFFNGSNSIAGTGATLSIPDAQPAQGGSYTVLVTNVFGAATSAPAMLQVIAPVPRTQVPGLALTNMPGVGFGLEYSASLSPLPNWTLLATVTMSASSQWYFDLAAPFPAQRFYRARQPALLPMPTFGLHMVPALTLTGSIGSSVRVDYINQFGSTDAWVTLATVTLTNTSQLYFDTSMIGQPSRLYRLVLQP